MLRDFKVKIQSIENNSKFDFLTFVPDCIMVVLFQILAVSLVGVTSGRLLTHFSIFVRLSISNQWKVLLSVYMQYSFGSHDYVISLACIIASLTEDPSLSSVVSA